MLLPPPTAEFVSRAGELLGDVGWLDVDASPGATPCEVLTPSRAAVDTAPVESKPPALLPSDAADGVDVVPSIPPGPLPEAECPSGSNKPRAAFPTVESESHFAIKY